MPSRKRPGVKGRITGTITDYLYAALRHAEYRILEDGTYWGEIPGIEGVWADENTLEDCRDELQSVLEDWIIVSLVNDLPIPSLDGIELTADKDVISRGLPAELLRQGGVSREEWERL